MRPAARLMAVATAAIAIVALLGPTIRPTPADSTGGYLLVDQAALLSLPTNGAAWTSLVSAAGASASPDLCDQDDKSDVTALANGLLYARIGQAAAAAKVRSLLAAAMASQRDGCNNAVLALGRQLGGYVLAADLIGDRDAAFVSWLSAIRTRDIGGHGRWYVLRDTSENSANNWGLWATASLIAADAYLGDETGLSSDWGVFSGYGDGSWPFQKTGSWSQDWSCPQGAGSTLPIAIDPVGCTLAGGYDGNGVTVEDASRSSFPIASTYIHEAVDALTISALLLARQGLPAWTVNDAQVCRAGAFADRVGRLNDFGGSKFAAWVLDAHCASHVPALTPTTGGRMLAFTDWLAPAWTGSPEPTPSLSPTATVAPTLNPTQTPTPPPTPRPTASPTPSPTETAAPSPSATVAPSATASPSPSPTPTLDPVIGAIESSDLSASDQALLEALYRRLLP